MAPLRYTDTDLRILSLLAGQPSHGYRILKQLEKDSLTFFTGRNQGPSTVYHSLHKLERHNLVQPSVEPGHKVPDHVRYEVTAKGLRLLHELLDTRETELRAQLNRTCSAYSRLLTHLGWIAAIRPHASGTLIRTPSR